MNRTYDYGNGIMELRNVEIKQREQSIKYHHPVDKDHYVNTKTGEVKKRSVPNTKAEIKNINRGMLQTFRLLLYNINKAIPAGKVYWFGMSNRNMISYEEFNSNIDKFIKRLKYANSKITDEKFKYAIFKEADEKGRFHIHGFIWYNENEKLYLSDELINSKWFDGMGVIKEISNTKDLMNTLFYVCNYSNKDKTNLKVIRKKDCLKYFTPNTHLVSMCKGLDEVPYEEVDDDYFPDMEKVISQSERDQKNIYYQSTFYDDK